MRVNVLVLALLLAALVQALSSCKAKTKRRGVTGVAPSFSGAYV